MNSSAADDFLAGANAIREARTVLIIKPSSLGDIVHALPTVAVIREAAPDAKIRWVANTEWVPLLANHPHIDEVIPFPRKEFHGATGAARFLDWSRALREPRPPELAIDLQGLLRSGLMAKRSRANLRYGLSDAREGARFFHTRSVDVSGKKHAVDRCLTVAGALGLPLPEEPEFILPEAEIRDETRSKLPTEAFVLFHPFSRGKGKSIAPSMVPIFCRAVEPMPVVVVGRLTEPMPELPDNTTNLVNNTSLPELIALIREANFTVSVDSGPMHLAAALTDSLLSLHTWSDPLAVGPYRKSAWVWKNNKIARVQETPAEWYASDLPSRLDEDAVLETGVWVRKFLSASPA
ncbi:MAG: glycosyltransferase family 9 protein [Verrucomicrobiota bacterium]